MIVGLHTDFNAGDISNDAFKMMNTILSSDPKFSNLIPHMSYDPAKLPFASECILFGVEVPQQNREANTTTTEKVVVGDGGSDESVENTEALQWLQTLCDVECAQQQQQHTATKTKHTTSAELESVLLQFKRGIVFAVRAQVPTILCVSSTAMPNGEIPPSSKLAVSLRKMLDAWNIHTSSLDEVLTKQIHFVRNVHEAFEFCLTRQDKKSLWLSKECFLPGKMPFTFMGYELRRKKCDDDDDTKDTANILYYSTKFEQPDVSCMHCKAAIKPKSSCFASKKDGDTGEFVYCPVCFEPDAIMTLRGFGGASSTWETNLQLLPNILGQTIHCNRKINVVAQEASVEEKKEKILHIIPPKGKLHETESLLSKHVPGACLEGNAAYTLCVILTPLSGKPDFTQHARNRKVFTFTIGPWGYKMEATVVEAVRLTTTADTPWKLTLFPSADTPLLIPDDIQDEAFQEMLRMYVTIVDGYVDACCTIVPSESWIKHKICKHVHDRNDDAIRNYFFKNFLQYREKKIPAPSYVQIGFIREMATPVETSCCHVQHKATTKTIIMLLVDEYPDILLKLLPCGFQLKVLSLTENLVRGNTMLAPWDNDLGKKQYLAGTSNQEDFLTALLVRNRMSLFQIFASGGCGKGMEESVKTKIAGKLTTDVAHVPDSTIQFFLTCYKPKSNYYQYIGPCITHRPHMLSWMLSSCVPSTHTFPANSATITAAIDKDDLESFKILWPYLKKPFSGSETPFARMMARKDFLCEKMIEAFLQTDLEYYPLIIGNDLLAAIKAEREQYAWRLLALTKSHVLPAFTITEANVKSLFSITSNVALIRGVISHFQAQQQVHQLPISTLKTEHEKFLKNKKMERCHSDVSVWLERLSRGIRYTLVTSTAEERKKRTLREGEMVWIVTECFGIRRQGSVEVPPEILMTVMTYLL